MKKVALLLTMFVCKVSIYAQEFDQTVVNTLKNCIRQEQYEIADSIINSFRDKDLSESSLFWLNFIHNDVGLSKYSQSKNAYSYLPYAQSGINAFNYLSHNINKENAFTFIDLWTFLFYLSDIFSQLNFEIVDSLSAFSNKYYNEYERKNPQMYYLVLLLSDKNRN